MREDRKGLYALCWRMLLFAPIGLFGLLALVVVVGLTFIAPLYAAVVLIDGRYLLGVVTFALWLVWLRFGGRARQFVFEGFGHGSL